MKYIKATVSDAEQILILVQDTIKRIYPKYYSKNIVDFFCELHYTLQKSRQDKTASTLFTGFRNPFIGKKATADVRAVMMQLIDKSSVKDII
ncbi:MAG: hypothetical protein LUG87_05815 [Oscillospiraceae bacterium]|nr:hypothetical protein [Oscillospiraceae bacterium]